MIRRSSPRQSLALLGPEYTYADFAADAFLKSARRKSSPFTKLIKNKIYKTTIEDVFTDVVKGKAHLGLVPIENRLYGTVRETLDGLFTHKVEIISMVELPIDHCIFTLPGAKKKDIKIIMSHAQALNQCKKYLKKNFKKADHVAVSSSAHAFSNVKAKNFSHIAVIGPKKSGKHYGFKMLDQNIADDPDNSTKFVVLTKKATNSVKKYKNPFLKTPKHTSIAFYFSSDKAGSLFKVFEIFAKNEVNMTKVESRPYKKDYGNYLFFIDFEGNPSQEKVALTLKQTSRIVAGLKVLGSF